MPQQKEIIMIEKIKGLTELKQKTKRLSKEDLVNMRGGGDDDILCKTFCQTACGTL